MPALRPLDPIRYGDIVLVADFVDPQGRNPKDRPCVVVTDPRSEPQPSRQLVIAISTVVPSPLPAEYVPLPWQDPHHALTGLNKPNAAICSWVAEVEEDRILRRIGIVPGSRLRIIAETLRRLAGEETPS